MLSLLKIVKNNQIDTSGLQTPSSDTSWRYFVYLCTVNMRLKRQMHALVTPTLEFYDKATQLFTYA